MVPPLMFFVFVIHQKGDHCKIINVVQNFGTTMHFPEDLENTPFKFGVQKLVKFLVKKDLTHCRPQNSKHIV